MLGPHPRQLFLLFLLSQHQRRKSIGSFANRLRQLELLCEVSALSLDQGEIRPTDVAQILRIPGHLARVSSGQEMHHPSVCPADVVLTQPAAQSLVAGTDPRAKVRTASLVLLQLLFGSDPLGNRSTQPSPARGNRLAGAGQGVGRVAT